MAQTEPTRYKVEIYLNSYIDPNTVTAWFWGQLSRIGSPVDPQQEQSTEVSVRPVGDRTKPPLGLDDLAPQLVRPATGDEAYRVQIPGLPEGTTVPVYDASASSKRLNGPRVDLVVDEIQEYDANIVPSNN